MVRLRSVKDWCGLDGAPIQRVTIAPDKLADMILVNGDPTANISDIRKIETVIKGGAVMYPGELYPAMGIRAK